MHAAVFFLGMMMMGKVVADVVWSGVVPLFHSGGNTTFAAVRHGSKDSFM